MLPANVRARPCFLVSYATADSEQWKCALRCIRARRLGRCWPKVSHTRTSSLTHKDYVEIMAFLLQQNGYPAGSTALTFEEAKESKVQLIYRGK